MHGAVGFDLGDPVVFVEQVVVAAAEHGQVPDVGRAMLADVHAVVTFAPLRWAVAAGVTSSDPAIIPATSTQTVLVR